MESVDSNDFLMQASKMYLQTGNLEKREGPLRENPIVDEKGHAEKEHVTFK
jgi:hypothetical protein